MEKRTEIVLSMIRKDKPTSVLARENGVAEATLHRWREQFLKGGEAGLRSSGSSSKDSSEMALLRKELEEHKQVIGEITVANMILKKMQSRFV